MPKLERLRENLCGELEKYDRKDNITTEDLEIIDKLTHSMKNLDKVMLGNEMINQYGYSGAYQSRNTYDNDEMSFGRQGRMTNRRSYNYSGHEEKDMERFKTMMIEALQQL